MKRAAAEGQRRRAQEGKAAPSELDGRPEPKAPEHVAPVLLRALNEIAQKVRSRKKR
jgi:hypothetical protein